MKTDLKLLSAMLTMSALMVSYGCSSNAASQTEATLDDHVWVWTKTIYNNDTTIEPAKLDAFTLSLNPNGNYSVSTDCNGSAGEYESDGSSLTFANTGMATLMFCEGSQENDFLAMLQNVQSYLFGSDGQLVLELKGHAGSMVFQ